MALNKRFMALVIGVVALGLTCTGIVLAVTNAIPSSSAGDPFVLNGYPPKSAELALTISSGTGARLSADVEVNFKTNRVQAQVSFPLVIATEAFDLRFIKNHVFARQSDVSSGTWYRVSEKIPSLFGVALEMTKPDIDLISGFHDYVTKSGYQKTYHFSRRNVPLGSLGGSSNAKLGSLHWNITVGSQGEVTRSTVVVRVKDRETTLAVQVLSYNQPALITTPPKSETEDISPKLIERLLKSQQFSSILIPKSMSPTSGSTLS